MDQNIRLPQVIGVFSRENKDLYYYMAVEAGMEMLKRREFRMKIGTRGETRRGELSIRSSLNSETP